jgi:aspartate/methionine/tyrosine aminotransferase
MTAVQDPVIPIVTDLLAQTPGAVSLGQGIVNYSPPSAIYPALETFSADPRNHTYKSVSGIDPLKEQIVRTFESDYGFAIESLERVVVTAGANMGFLNALLSVASLGDEVILLAPYYFNHEMAIQMMGCHAVIVDTDEQHQPILEAIDAAITERTRAVVTVSPNNPTGVVYPVETLRAINRKCRERGLYHISDEAYAYFTYADAVHVSSSSFADAHNHTISLFSLSKAYGFASWRIGYMIVPEHLLPAIKKVQDTNVICPPVVSQWAALAALCEGEKFYRPHIEALADVRLLVKSKLDSLGDLVFVPSSKGAFYFFVSVATDMESMEMVKRLIKEFGIAVLPGSAFGVKDKCNLRLSYGALSPDSVAEAMGRFVEGVSKLAG